jgi:hypothetical protein
MKHSEKKHQMSKPTIGDFYKLNYNRNQEIELQNNEKKKLRNHQYLYPISIR